MTPQLSASELSKILKLSLRGLELLIRKGDAPPFYRVGRSRRWDPAVVQQWIEERTAAESASRMKGD